MEVHTYTVELKYFRILQHDQVVKRVQLELLTEDVGLLGRTKCRRVDEATGANGERAGIITLNHTTPDILPNHTCRLQLSCVMVITMHMRG